MTSLSTNHILHDLTSQPITEEEMKEQARLEAQREKIAKEFEEEQRKTKEKEEEVSTS